MNVLLVTPLYPPDIGGPATYTKLLADELPKSGVMVEVLSFGTVRHLPQGVRHVVFFWKVLRRGRDADVIFAQDPLGIGLPSAVAALILRKKFLIKVVGDRAWEHWKSKNSIFESPEAFQSTSHGFGVAVRRFVQRFVTKRARVVVTPSAYLKRIVASWGIDGARITVIHNAFEAWETVTTKEDARKELGFAGKVIVSVGRLVSWKGFLTLIGLMPALRKEFPDIRLYVIGTGPDEAELQAEITRLHLDGTVRLTGGCTREEVLEYLRAGDLFVLNTGYEGMSHVLLEAMAMEVPVITTDMGGNPEVVEDGVSGILVSYDNRDAMKKAIMRLLRDGTFCRDLVAGAKIKLTAFGRDRMMNEITRLLRTL